MPEDKKNKMPLAVPAVPGRRQTRAKHGIHSWVDSKRLPQGRAFTKTRRELGKLRTAMIDRRGGDEKVTPEELILIDSAIEALGVQKLLGLYVKKYGILDGPSAKEGRIELTPILSKSWVAYANVTRAAIMALNNLSPGGRDDDTLTPLQLAAVIDEEKAGKACSCSGNGPGRGKAGKVAGNEGKDLDVEDGPALTEDGEEDSDE